MKEKDGKPDYILITVSAILICLGILILASVSAIFSQEKFGSPTFFLFRQIIVGLIPGVLLGFIAFKVPLTLFKKWAPFLLLIILFFMVLVFIPKIGMSLGGAKRWIDLGPISFQPSEFLKPFFILYLAAWLSGRIGTDTSFAPKISKAKTRIKTSLKFAMEGLERKALIPFLVIIGVTSMLLVFQPDISTLGIIVLVATLMYFLSGTPLKHTFLIIAIGIAGLASLTKIAPYRLNRLLVFIKPDIDPMGMGYQIKQSLIAVGSGGITGLGLGMSAQKFGFLPQPMSDSIFAIFAEETGLIGGLILIFLFLIFAWRGFKISKNTGDKFLQLTCLGITSWIVIQAFVNIGSMIGILPLTGIPLPFISYGGSALVAELIGVGILLNISKS